MASVRYIGKVWDIIHEITSIYVCYYYLFMAKYKLSFQDNQSNNRCKFQSITRLATHLIFLVAAASPI